MEFTSDLDEAAYLIPSSLEEATMMTAKCVASDSSFRMSSEFLSHMSRKVNDQVMRRLENNISIQAGGAVKINGKNASAEAIITRVREHYHAGYKRRTNILVPSSLPIVSLEVMAKGKMRMMKRNFDDSWTFVDSDLNDDHSVLVERADYTMCVSAECFPPCITVRSSDSIDTHILMEIPEWVELKEVPIVPPNPKMVRGLPRTRAIEGGISRVTDFLRKVPSFTTAVASAMVGEDPVSHVERVLTFISEIPDLDIRTNVLLDVKTCITEFMTMRMLEGASAWIFSLLISEGTMNLTYGIHSGEDGPAVWALLKKYMYDEGHITSTKRDTEKRNETTVDRKYETLDDLLAIVDDASLASSMELQEMLDEDSLDEDEAEMLGIGVGKHEEEEVVEEESDDVLELITQRASVGKVEVRTKYFPTKKASDRIMDGHVVPFITMLTRMASIEHRKTTNILGSSACLITSHDIIESMAPSDVCLMEVIADPIITIFTCLNSSRFSRMVSQARLEIATKEKRNPDLFITIGMAGEKRISLSSIDGKRMIAKVPRRKIADLKLKDPTIAYSKMSYIGNLGKVEL